MWTDTDISAVYTRFLCPFAINLKLSDSIRVTPTLYAENF